MPVLAPMLSDIVQRYSGNASDIFVMCGATVSGPGKGPVPVMQFTTICAAHGSYMFGKSAVVTVMRMESACDVDDVPQQRDESVRK